VTLGISSRVLALGHIRQAEIELNEAALALDENDGDKAWNCLRAAKADLDKAAGQIGGR
jgi:hypothetical protein